MGTDVEQSRWELSFYGAAKKGDIKGIWCMDCSPDGIPSPAAMKLEFPATSNITEYEACVLGMEMAFDRGIRYLDVYGDSALIISQIQIQGKYRTRDSKLQPCNKHQESVVSRFSYVEFHYLPREKNSFADAIAALACGYAVGR